MPKTPRAAPVANFDGALPTYDDLPPVPNQNARCAWGVFGPNDEVGALNLSTPRRRLEALRTVRLGQVINLSPPLNQPQVSQRPGSSPQADDHHE